MVRWSAGELSGPGKRKGGCDAACQSSGEGFAGNGNKLTRNTGAVTVLDSEGSRMRAWEFDAVYPVRWSGPEFSSSSNEALQEQLEVVHHGFRSKNL